ncbi:MAG: 2-amino-4-hydroxy-6-hydroxymethyldihydropteridine diphosphokinase, partial [Bacteroidota bacterium]
VYLASKMPTVYLLTGTNMGDRLKMLGDMADYTGKLIGIIQNHSKIYETEPWGFTSDMWFMNQVLKVDTEQKPDQVLDIIIQIEKELGRVRNRETVYSSRTADMDILFFGNEIIQSDRLQIPHKHLHERKFALVPLSEIAPDFIHPVKGLSIAELLQNCMDESVVRLYS